MRALGLPLYRHAHTGAQRKSRTLPQPSWTIVLVVTAAVAGITWGLMQRQVPDIDPRHVIALNLAAARLAMEDQRFVDPPERSAMHYYATVLSLDATNAEALRGTDAIAGRYVDIAKQAILEDRFADAVTAIDTVRRVQPTHPRVVFLETELRKGLERRVAALKYELSTATAATKPARTQERSARTPKKASAERATTEAAPPSIAEIEQAEAALQASLIERLESDQIESRQTDTSQAYAAVEAAYEATKRHLSAVPTFQPAAVVKSVEEPSVPTTPIAKEPSEPKVVEPKIVRWVQPNYPDRARIRGMEGWVDLLVTVAPSGDVTEALVEASSGSRSFERAAIAAAKKWKYQPWSPEETMMNDRVPVRVAFKLEEVSER